VIRLAAEHERLHRLRAWVTPCDSGTRRTVRESRINVGGAPLLGPACSDLIGERVWASAEVGRTAAIHADGIG
jgi:hypothetical protein